MYYYGGLWWRVYGFVQRPEAVDWGPRGSGAVESTISALWTTRFRPTELIIRVYTLYFEIVGPNLKSGPPSTPLLAHDVAADTIVP